MNEHLYGLIYTEWVDILGVANVTDRERYEILRYLIYEYVKLNHGIENPYEMPRGNAEPTARVLRDNLVRVHSAYARKKPHARTDRKKQKQKQNIKLNQNPLSAFDVVSQKNRDTSPTDEHLELYEIGLRMLSNGLRIDASEMLRANLTCEKLQEFGQLRKNRTAYIFGASWANINKATGAEYAALLREFEVTDIFAQEIADIRTECGTLIIECSEFAAQEMQRNYALCEAVDALAKRKGCREIKKVIRKDIWNR